MLERVIAAGCLLWLAGCTVNTYVPSSGAGAAEVMTSRVVNSPTSFTHSLDMASLQPSVGYSGYMCSAWHFRADVAMAIARSFQATNEAAFRNIVDGGGRNGLPAPGASYNVDVSLDNFDAQISASQGFYEVEANSNADISLRIRVIDVTGYQVLQTIVSGEGNATATGQCNAGGIALSQALAKAVKHAAENYADKVINSGLLH